MTTRHELVMLLVGAVLGAVAGQWVASLAEKELNWSLLAIVTFSGCTIALVLVASLGSLKLILGGRKPFDLTGEWHGSFQYEKNGSNVVITERLAIMQRGRMVKGVSRSLSVTGDFPLVEAKYEFRATLRPDGVLEGRWSSSRNSAYYGLLQATIKRSGSPVRGVWLGVDSNSERINVGEFEWSRM